ncbi:hypothetical protein [Fundidesulfovibrio putealis]|uniref:hypothetical protein n=1 Tax=Fundidesulfovibrio putealis TaxID=270496 RepID=UPI000422ADBF|nr:hypothetical protein [Fundidesulfovibrio putealis]
MRFRAAPYLVSVLCLLGVLSCAIFALAQPPGQPGRAWLPPDLRSWEGWVLYGQDSAQCPPLATDPARRQCQFPTRISLVVDGSGASFTATWRVFSPMNAPLPVAPGLWPARVTVDGQSAAVLDQSGTPAVRLEPGEHQVSGQLPWKRRPQALRIAPQTGVVELAVDGVAVAAPKLAADGRLDISRQDERKAPEDSAQVAVFRLLRDGVPMTITTLARLEVSGRVRTIALDGLLPPGTEPMAVQAPVPVGFGPGGQVLAQAGAGRYDLEIVSRALEPMKAMGPATTPFGREIWAFAADPALRDVQPRGLAPIDPQTTELPDAWKKYPAFLAEKDAVLTLDVIRRGESGPRSDDLNVRRTLWLDFDGAGFTVQDRLSGALRHGWSLSMNAPGELGRAAQAGKDLPVVLLGEDKLPGVELRESAVNLTAESRYPDAGAAVPASGWLAGVTSLSAELKLPPGWRLFHASGPDTVSQSWVSRWNLLNIFLTLFMVLGAWKLRGVAAGGVLLAYLVAAQHEQAAPVELWLLLLAALGILKALDRQASKESWQKAARGARAFHMMALGLMVLAALPFVFSQIRTGVYPQLEDVRFISTMAERAADLDSGMESQDVAAPAQAPAPMAAKDSRKEVRKAAREPSGPYAYQGLEQDPNSLIQTGPGIPNWNWRTVGLTWNGPVDPAQTVRLTLVSPMMNAALCFARVILLLAALWLLADFRRLRGEGGLLGSKATGPAAGDGASGSSGASPAKLACLAAMLSAALLMAPGALLAAPESQEAFRSGVPPKEILDELRARLIKPSDCFPDCAGISELGVVLDAKVLRLTLETGAATRLALPLPVVGDGWRPQSVTVDSKPAVLFAENGGLWALLDPGPHKVIVSGAAPAGVSFSISAPFSTRRAVVDAPGWSVLGLGPDGALEGGLKFSRREDASQAGKPGSAATAITAVIQPFLEVERSLELGLSWEAVTTVRRLTQTGEPVVIQVPLLPGESVLDRDVRVADGKAVAALGAGQRQLSWRSRLEIQPALDLSAPQGVNWVEIWRLRAAPSWDVALSGIPVSSSLDASGHWAPLWRPWPGETARIAVTRPAPAPGQSLTIDSAKLRLTPGERLDAVSLEMALRSALGGRHVLHLPEKAEVTGVVVGGKPSPWSGDKPGEIGLALTPGRQSVLVSWRQPRESLTTVSTPAVSLGHEAVNAVLTVEMPRDRWILWARGATRMAPAILFWSALGATALVAFGLGFLPFTPLRRWQWLLLGLGLTQVSPGVALLAVAWIIALGLRRGYKASSSSDWFGFNAMQIGLAILTLIGLSCLFEAIRTGLLGSPTMHIMGNGSSAYRLIWSFDRVGETLPQAQVFSVSLWWYRGVMLAWSLWMAFSLLGWLRWGWDSFSDGRAWRKPELRKVKRPEPPLPPEQDRRPQLREGLAPAGQGTPEAPAGPGAPGAPEGPKEPDKS